MTDIRTKTLFSFLATNFVHPFVLSFFLSSFLYFIFIYCIYSLSCIYLCIYSTCIYFHLVLTWGIHAAGCSLTKNFVLPLLILGANQVLKGCLDWIVQLLVSASGWLVLMSLLSR